MYSLTEDILLFVQTRDIVTVSHTTTQDTWYPKNEY